MAMPEKVIVPVGRDPGMGHFYVSMIKSFLRIAAGATLINGLFLAAGILFIVAELLGILEELV
jgi:hypothetical protein